MCRKINYSKKRFYEISFHDFTKKDQYRITANSVILNKKLGSLTLSLTEPITSDLWTEGHQSLLALTSMICLLVGISMRLQLETNIEMYACHLHAKAFN